MSFLGWAARCGAARWRRTGRRMSALGAISVAALNDHSLGIMHPSQFGALNQAVLRIANLRILSSEHESVGCGIIIGAIAFPDFVRLRDDDTAGGDHVRYFIVLEMGHNVRRLHDLILLLGPNVARIVDDACGFVIIQSV